MITGAVVIIHNKSTAAQNRAQITFFNNNTTKVAGDNPYYTINGIATPPHQIYYLQVVPNGITVPTNIDLISSYKVYFGNDQPSIDRRFYNWAIRRAGQLYSGCDVVIVITDHTQITLQDFINAMQEIAGPEILVRRNWGWIFEWRIFEKIQHQLTEQGMTLSEAIAELKQRITDAGYTFG